MIPEIKTITPKKLVGKRMRMTLSDNKTTSLWQSFMPRRNDVLHKTGEDLFSMQVYDKDFELKNFNLQTSFDKWAAIEVSKVEGVPAGMESFDLPGGLYAVFMHKGAADTAYETFGYIFKTWLPASAYELDNRPHFEILGEKYKNNDPDSEEEVWIPIKPKN